MITFCWLVIFVHSGYNFIHYGYNWLGAPLWLHFFLGSQWTWIDGTVNDGNVNFYPRRARCVSGSETTNHSSCNHARDDEMSDAKNCSERDPIRQTKRCRSSHETVASTSPGSVWPGKRDISAMSAMRFEMGTTSAMPSAVRIVSNRAASGAVRNKKM